jgi:hypothetical protein
MLSVHVELLNVPVPLLVNVIVPCGVIAPEPDVSATVAVHVLGWLTWTLLGEQLTVVPVVRTVAVTVVLALLPVCALSPPNDAVMVWEPTTLGV